MQKLSPKWLLEKQFNGLTSDFPRWYYTLQDQAWNYINTAINLSDATEKAFDNITEQRNCNKILRLLWVLKQHAEWNNTQAELLNGQRYVIWGII